MKDITLIKLLELADEINDNETEMEDYFHDITVEEAINRFRFILNYFNIKYEEVSIVSKDVNLLSYDFTFFELNLNVLEQIDIKKFRIDLLDIDVENNKLIIGFKEPII